MRLAALANSIYTLLSTAPDSTWSYYKPKETPDSGELSELLLMKAIDPTAELEDGIQKLIVVPIVNEYNKQESTGRGNVISINKNPRIALVISRPFITKDSSGFDASSWQEAERTLNFREEVDEYVLANIKDILSIEPEPPQELMLDKRWFLSVTELTFDRMACL